MKKFKNLITGAVETITNPMLIEQYKKHTDRYVEVKGSSEKATNDGKKTKKSRKTK